jgi:aminoglycoside/choline kinase family phosphotransferase
MESTLARKTELTTWLSQLPGLSSAELTPIAGDASFRRYYRVQTRTHTYVAMDAPPTLEKSLPFVAIAYALKNVGLNTPEIFAADLDHGFLLLTDFGDRTYLNTLKPDNADHLYGKALDALAVLQTCEGAVGYTVPPFTASFMQQEWMWHQEWVFDQWLGCPLDGSVLVELTMVYDALVQSALEQPQVFMHRDFHAGNLMVLPLNGVGILDFQDAFIGPLTYDLASLLRDCYIAWPESQVYGWAAAYLDRLQAMGLFTAVNEAVFLRWFDWMGVQRHLKAMLTFARKHVRDKDSSYLKFMPRTLNYILSVTARYQELKPLHDYYASTVYEAMRGVMPVCVV